MGIETKTDVKEYDKEDRATTYENYKYNGREEGARNTSKSFNITDERPFKMIKYNTTVLAGCFGRSAYCDAASDSSRLEGEGCLETFRKNGRTLPFWWRFLADIFVRRKKW